MKKINHILGTTKFEVRLQNFSEVSTRAECGGTICLGITIEASRIFHVLVLSLQGII